MNAETLSLLSRQYARSIAEVIETTTGIEVDIIEGLSTNTDAAIVAVAVLQGEESGILTIQSNADTLRMLTSFMTGIAEEDVSEGDLRDCLHEIINMTIGIVKTKTAEQKEKHQIAAPFILTGESIRFFCKEHAMHSICKLVREDLFLEMNVFF